MFKPTTKDFDKELFPELTRAIQTLPDTLADDALELAVDLENELTAIYAEAPPRGNQKFIWSSDPVKNANARRTWFWLVKTGKVQTDGKHYLRQGKPPYGAKVLVEQNDIGVRIIVTNTWGKSGMIFGKLKANGDTRLIGHRKTLWVYAYPKVKKAMAFVMNELDNRALARLRKG